MVVSELAGDPSFPPAIKAASNICSAPITDTTATKKCAGCSNGKVIFQNALHQLLRRPQCDRRERTHFLDQRGHVLLEARRLLRTNGERLRLLP